MIALNDVRYLYYYGEYVSENEKRTAMHLNELPLETIQKMADVYTEGYRIGFVNTGKNLSKKATVNIRYTLGFERVIRIAIENFRKMGLKPTIYRAGVSVLTKRQHLKIGYYGGIANKQYEYDHKDDQALILESISSWNGSWKSCAQLTNSIKTWQDIMQVRHAWRHLARSHLHQCQNQRR